MSTAALPSGRSRGIPGLLPTGGVLAAALVGVLVDAVSTASLVVLLVAMASLVVMAMAFRDRYKRLLYSPIGFLYGFLLLSCALVPILWDLGLAQPWPEIAGAQSQVTLAGALFLGLAALIIAVGLTRVRPERGVAVLASDGALNWLLLAGLICGLAGLAGVLAAVGGFETLIRSLTSRRSVLASTGPLLVLVTVPAVASVIAISLWPRNPSTRALLLLNVGVYMFACLTMGNRFQALVVLLAGVAAFARRGNIDNRKVIAGLLIIVPLSVLYLYQVRQGLSYGKAYGEIETGSLVAFLRSTVDPFVSGGLDVLRTIGAVFFSTDLVSLRLDTILGSFAGVIPRAVWPGKPPGSSVAFSQEYFAASWARGTGVPPSLPAEAIFVAGVLGGLLIFMGIVALVTAVTRRLVDSRSLFATVMFAFLAADSVVLVKSGMDSFIKYLVVHVIAVALVVLLARTHFSVAVTCEPKTPAHGRGAT